MRAQDTNTGGFTLIELILVLAVSSALALILVGLQTQQTNRSRFSNAMERVASFAIQAKAEANATIGEGSPTHVVDRNRIIFGKALVFSTAHAGQVRSYTVTAANRNDNRLCGLRITDGPQKIMNLPWSVEFNGSDRAVVYGRSPADGRLRTYIFEGSSSFLLDGGCADSDSQYMNPGAVPIAREQSFISPQGYGAVLVVRGDGSSRVRYE